MSASRIDPPIAIRAAAAVSAFGLSWRGLGRAIREGSLSFSPSNELSRTHPGTLASEVGPIPAASDAGDARQRKLMARAARLAAIAARLALKEAAPNEAEDRGEIGFYLGVGASGGAISDLEAVLRASIEGDRISLTRLGDEGLSATNPVATFQLLNNFTLAHAAILEGLGGPNGAFFSRGGGTVFALMEAAAAIAEGDCRLALAGGADSALHPVTWAELAREGKAASGLVPGEGAAMLALSSSDANPLGFVEHISISSGEGGLDVALRDLGANLRGLAPDLVVLAPWGEPPRALLRSFLDATFPGVPSIDASLTLGDALAAGPALAWVAALDLLSPDVPERSPPAQSPRRALILSAGIDGQLGAVVLTRARHEATSTSISRPISGGDP